MDNKQVNKQNPQNQKEERKNLTKKERLVLKVSAGVIAAIAAINAIYYVIMMFFLEKNNFYMHHFLIPIDMICIGVLAIIMPYTNKYSSYSANTKGDKYMYIIGIGLIFCAFVMLIGSFMS